MQHPVHEPRSSAEAVVSLLETLQFDAVVERFTQQMREAVSREELERVWLASVEQWGAFMEHGEPIAGQMGAGIFLFDIPLRFENGKAHLQVVIDADRRIPGLFLQPGDPTGSFGG